jgi:short-subunit dehydrogenase
VKGAAPAKSRYGPAALVTGASDGIGLSCAEALASDGFDLILVARRVDRLRALADRLVKQHGIKAVVVACDLGEPGATAQVAAATTGMEVGLVIAAAGYGLAGSFLDNSLADELDMIDVNCRAVAELVHHFAAPMVARRAGGIILFSSIVAFQGVPGQANYAATKAWVQVFAEGLRRELQPAGVDVLAVAPGPVATGFAARAGLSMGAAERPEIVARASLNALGRTGTVRPGTLATLLEASLSLLPRRGRTRILEQVMAGMMKKPE